MRPEPKPERLECRDQIGGDLLVEAADALQIGRGDDQPSVGDGHAEFADMFPAHRSRAVEQAVARSADRAEPLMIGARKRHRRADGR